MQAGARPPGGLDWGKQPSSSRRLSFSRASAEDGEGCECPRCWVIGHSPWASVSRRPGVSDAVEDAG